MNEFVVYLLLLDGQELVKNGALLVRQGKLLAVFNDDDLTESRRTVFALKCLSQLLVDKTNYYYSLN